MTDLETITAGVLLASMGATIFGGIPLAIVMTTYARLYNLEKRKEFLESKLRKNNLTNIQMGESKQDLTRKGILLTPIELNGEKYIMESQHQKSSWFADLFYDTRLYDPVNLVPQ